MFRTFTNAALVFGAALSAVFVPQIAFAQDVVSLFNGFISVVSIIIPILIALAVLVFFWGLVKFISHAEDAKGNEEGKQLIIWGLITIFVMVAFWGIIGWLQTELQLGDAGSLGTLPQQPDTIPTP